jgi:hypothetical protein
MCMHVRIVVTRHEHILKCICLIYLLVPNRVVGCRHIYMQRQPRVDLFDNIYYNRTVYTDVLEQLDSVGSSCFGILTRRTARYKLTA